MSDVTNGPAFPGIESPGGGYAGMTLRDYFAAKALDLAFLVEQKRPTGPSLEATYAGVATRAYKMADAMLKERSK